MRCWGICLVILLFVNLSTLEAQRSRRRGRSLNRIQERIEQALQQELTRAIELLEQNPSEFDQTYLSKGQFNQPVSRWSSSERNRLLEVLKLFENAEVQVNEGNRSAVAVTSIDDETAQKLQPPKKSATRDRQGRRGGYGAKLPKVLESAIEDLERKNYKRFVTSIYPTAQIERMRKADRLESYLQQLSTRPKLLQLVEIDLREMQEREPELTIINGQTVAIFRVRARRSWGLAPQEAVIDTKLPTEKPRKLILELIDGQWRFLDGNRPLRAAIEERGNRTSDGNSSLAWKRTDAGWKITRIPFF